jgi:RNA polymerase sigma-70 factor (ECF subfamily)
MPKRTRGAEGGKGGCYPPLADEELISLMGEGDAGAFAALYDRHGRAAYTLSYRMTGERQAAEDLVQDAFLKVWRSAGTYRSQRGSVKTWLLSIVHNRGIDLLRSYACRRRTREKAEAEAPRSHPGEAFSEAWSNHRRDRLREALRDIPRDQREVLALGYQLGRRSSSPSSSPRPWEPGSTARSPTPATTRRPRDERWHRPDPGGSGGRHVRDPDRGPPAGHAPGRPRAATRPLLGRPGPGAPYPAFFIPR